jgi:hypothetical protein
MKATDKNLLDFMKALQKLTQFNINFLLVEESNYFPDLKYLEELKMIQSLINSFDFVKGKHESGR